MKKVLIQSIIFLLTGIASTAQPEQKIRVPAGEDLMKAIAEYGEYRFPQYTKGTVVYKYHKSSSALLNYNLLLGEMRFIDPSGDTLAIADPDQVSAITIDSITFYYSNGYQEAVAENGSVKLTVLRKITIEYEKNGAYGQPNTQSAIDNYRTYTDNGYTYKLSINQDAVVRKNSKWFLVDAEGNSTPATKANFIKLFPVNNNSINSYIKSKNTDFKNEEDLKALLRFCGKGE